jgi:photosystem II stability/assembly factor-like uncharacterized protein
MYVLSVTISGMNLFVGTSRCGVFLSTDNGTSWTAVNSDMSNTAVSALAVSGTNLFALSDGEGVSRSTDSGATWTAVNNGLTNTYANALAMSGTNLFAGTSRGVFLSTDKGANWTPKGLKNASINALAVDGANLFAGAWSDSDYSYVFLSTNNGTDWTQIYSPGYGVEWSVRCLTVSGTSLFATGPFGVFGARGSTLTVRLFKNGTNWGVQNLNLPSPATCFAVSGTNVFAGTWARGVYLSSDSGSTWTPVNSGMTNTMVNALVVSGTNLLAGADGKGFFLSTNNGASWTQDNSGMTDTNVYSLAVSGTNLFAGTYYRGVWKRLLSEMIASAQSPSSLLPGAFKLDQNYPNPFNPATTIRYSLPHRSQVLLSVYNTVGQKVTALVQGEQDAGSYEVKFDGSGLASGVYFYRLQTESFVDTKKLLLLR